MALTDENGGMNTTMLVSPATSGYPYPVYMGGGNGSSGGNGGWDNGNGWWIILLFILLASGNWGNQYGNGNGSFGGGQPIIVNDGANGSAVQRGFDQAAIMSGIAGVQNGVQDIATQLCNGFAGVNATVNGGFANAETAANARQMASMNQAFAAQTAMAQGFNALGTQFADCCCENRLASADLKYTIATENCADRAALSDGLRDVIANQNAGIQKIIDKLCDQELFAERRENDNLRQQLNMANLAASQNAQNALIQQGFANEVDALYNRLNSCPVPTTPVYGRTPIFTCNGQNAGCGCGCGGSF